MNPPVIPSHVASTATRTTQSVVESSTLFQGSQEVVIRHDGHEYRLRITRQNKLILTK